MAKRLILKLNKFLPISYTDRVFRVKEESNFYSALKVIKAGVSQGHLILYLILERDLPVLENIKIVTRRHIVESILQNYSDKRCHFILVYKTGKSSLTKSSQYM